MNVEVEVAEAPVADEVDDDVALALISNVPDIWVEVVTVAKVVGETGEGVLWAVFDDVCVGFLRGSSAATSLSTKISTIFPAAPRALMTFPKSPYTSTVIPIASL